MKTQKVIGDLKKHIIIDGYPVVFDFERSHGCYVVDKETGNEYLDFYTFFATLPVGYGHPVLESKETMKRLSGVAKYKIANSDMYSQEYAEFVDTFEKIAAPKSMPHYFFVEGGAPAVENGLKTAFDWKVKKNFRKGYKEEIGKQVMHFREAFHGRTGYTLSLTNTNLVKTEYYPKFDWPRISNPKIIFPLEGKNLEDVKERERKSIEEMDAAFDRNGDDIAAIIIEPIQGEGGDNHFRKEFFVELRKIADEREAMLIFDEVQTGVGTTGKMWCFQHFGVEPDIFAFCKKLHVGGICVSKRVDEVKDNVFTVSSRINSTFGGNIVDMVRATIFLEIIEREKLVKNSEKMGSYLLKRLLEMQEQFPELVNNVRGRGLLCAFNMPTKEDRDKLHDLLFNNGMLILKSGDTGFRFRPVLDIKRGDIDAGIDRFVCCLNEMTNKSKKCNIGVHKFSMHRSL